VIEALKNLLVQQLVSELSVEALIAFVSSRSLRCPSKLLQMYTTGHHYPSQAESVRPPGRARVWSTSGKRDTLQDQMATPDL